MRMQPFRPRVDRLDEVVLDDRLQGVAAIPRTEALAGVVVLAGSSGRIDVSRARLLASRGAVAVALRWFGGRGQPREISEVPLESIVEALDWLEARACSALR